MECDKYVADQVDDVDQMSGSQLVDVLRHAARINQGVVARWGAAAVRLYAVGSDAEKSEARKLLGMRRLNLLRKVGNGSVHLPMAAKLFHERPQLLSALSNLPIDDQRDVWEKYSIDLVVDPHSERGWMPVGLDEIRPEQICIAFDGSSLRNRAGQVNLLLAREQRARAPVDGASRESVDDLLSGDEKRRFRHAAKTQGLSIAQYLRKLLNLD